MNKHGQSMIEYSLIAVLIILGIVVMGPYVLRSVGAHFKLWDDSIQDSATERITQAPVADVPDLALNCKCTNPDTPEGCGSTLAGSQCGANERIYSHDCSPQGCDGAPASNCQPDSSCCGAWTPLGCGNYPCPDTGCPTTTTPPPVAGNCYFGQDLEGQQCGSNSTEQCVPDPTCPLPACIGTTILGETPCSNGPPGNGAPLTRNHAKSFVAAQSSCVAGAFCQYSCPGGWGFQNGVCIQNIVTFTLHESQFMACFNCRQVCAYQNRPFGPGTNCAFGPDCGLRCGIAYQNCTYDKTDNAYNCGTCLNDTLVSGTTCPDGIASIISEQNSPEVFGICLNGTAGVQNITYTVTCNP